MAGRRAARSHDRHLELGGTLPKPAQIVFCPLAFEALPDLGIRTREDHSDRSPGLH